MSETVIRHRGQLRDENGKLTTAVPDRPLSAILVEPRGGSENVEPGRDGESVACSVYFMPGTDVLNGDQLTVRDEKFDVVVNDWMVSGRGVVEVLCSRGQG